MAPAMEHCRRPWWKRPPVWIIGILVIAVGAGAVIEQIGRRATMPYSTFLDQVDAGRIASVTFNGTAIQGRYKTPPDNPASGGAAPSDSFRSRVPDFGDPALIPELRGHSVAIVVQTPSPWAWLLGRLPWPMLILIGVVLIAGIVRLVRGGKAPAAASAPMMPGRGMIAMLSGLFGSPPQATGHEPQKHPPPGRP